MAQANKVSKSQKVRNMLTKGHDVAYIAKTLSVKPQMVYNIRWRMNKKAGLGAIATNNPNTVIVTPPSTPEQLYQEQLSEQKQILNTKKESSPSLIQRIVAVFRGW